MTKQEMRDRSAAKIKEIKELANKLQVRFEAKQTMLNNCLENVVFFIDQEAYEMDEEAAPTVVRGPSTGIPPIMTNVESIPKTE